MQQVALGLLIFAGPIAIVLFCGFVLVRWIVQSRRRAPAPPRLTVVAAAPDDGSAPGAPAGAEAPPETQAPMRRLHVVDTGESRRAPGR